MTDQEIFAQYDDEFLKFENVTYEQRQRLTGGRATNRPDLCAFLILDRIFPKTGDIVMGAEHDEIFLDPEADELVLHATEEEIITLIRCGVRYHDESGSLAMFA